MRLTQHPDHTPTSAPSLSRGSLRDAVLSWPVWLIHAIALVTPILAPPTWNRLALVACTYLAMMFFITAGYHRYFGHRSFKTSRISQFILAFLTMISLQKGVIWWASTHRIHHRTADTPADPHSPVHRGLWWAHIGWTLSLESNGRDDSVVGDLLGYRELVWLDALWMIPPLTYMAFIGLIAGWQGLLWGYVLPVVLCWHASYTVNSLSHVWGTQRYDTGDASRNNLITALITLGEGWHNNHHRFPGSARQGRRWWEVDLTFYGLWLLSWTGVIGSLGTVKEPKER